MYQPRGMWNNLFLCCTSVWLSSAFISSQAQIILCQIVSLPSWVINHLSSVLLLGFQGSRLWAALGMASNSMQPTQRRVPGWMIYEPREITCFDWWQTSCQSLFLSFWPLLSRWRCIWSHLAAISIEASTRSWREATAYMCYASPTHLCLFVKEHTKRLRVLQPRRAQKLCTLPKSNNIATGRLACAERVHETRQDVPTHTHPHTHTHKQRLIRTGEIQWPAALPGALSSAHLASNRPMNLLTANISFTPEGKIKGFQQSTEVQAAVDAPAQARVTGIMSVSSSQPIQSTPNCIQLWVNSKEGGHMISLIGKVLLDIGAVTWFRRCLKLRWGRGSAEK